MRGSGSRLRPRRGVQSGTRPSRSTATAATGGSPSAGPPGARHDQSAPRRAPPRPRGPARRALQLRRDLDADAQRVQQLPRPLVGGPVGAAQFEYINVLGPEQLDDIVRLLECALDGIAQHALFLPVLVIGQRERVVAIAWSLIDFDADGVTRLGVRVRKRDLLLLLFLPLQVIGFLHTDNMFSFFADAHNLQIITTP